MKMRHSLMGTLLIASTSLVSAQNLLRLSADFQNTQTGADEVATSASADPDGAGGMVVYSKTLPAAATQGLDVLYITFSGQGDVHFGSALLMTAFVGNDLIEPLAGQTGSGGNGPTTQTGWYTLLNLPQAADVSNCNNGGGGTADCHDNTLYFSGCKRLAGPAHDRVVQIKLANLGGGTSFYERATIYIDGQSDPTGKLCQGAGLPDPSKRQ